MIPAGDGRLEVFSEETKLLNPSPIRVATVRDGVHVAVSASDEGRSVPLDLLPHLFRRYVGRAGPAGGRSTTGSRRASWTGNWQMLGDRPAGGTVPGATAERAVAVPVAGFHVPESHANLGTW